MDAEGDKEEVKKRCSARLKRPREEASLQDQLEHAISQRSRDFTRLIQNITPAELTTIKTEHGTLAHFAAAHNARASLKALLKKVPELSSATNSHQLTPLQMAITHGSTTVFSFLYNRQFPKKDKNRNVTVPLFCWAARKIDDLPDYPKQRAEEQVTYTPTLTSEQQKNSSKALAKIIRVFMADKKETQMCPICKDVGIRSIMTCLSHCCATFIHRNCDAKNIFMDITTHKRSPRCPCCRTKIIDRKPGRTITIPTRLFNFLSDHHQELPAIAANPSRFITLPGYTTRFLRFHRALGIHFEEEEEEENDEETDDYQIPEDEI